MIKFDKPVFTAISCISAVTGALFSFRNRHNKRKYIGYGVITAGVLGLLYNLDKALLPENDEDYEDE